VLEALVPAILEQKVTGTEAWRGLRGLIHGWGEPAPGPFGLRLLPEASVLAGSVSRVPSTRRGAPPRRPGPAGRRSGHPFEEVLGLARDAA